MGLFNFSKKQNKSDSFDSFPNLTSYRLYIFLKSGDINKVKAQMDEFYELYPNEIPFSAQLYQLGPTPWTYLVLNHLPNVGSMSPIWYYLDYLLWMSDSAELSFAFAYSVQAGELPLFASRDFNNPNGDSCTGISNGKHFHATVPGEEVNWGQSVSNQFDYVEYIRGYYGVDISTVL
ncbi:MAG: hypothetical protein K6G22_05210 [Lachnospiraceae bacterium]|nr:hypothetical protein [Lachnospiraceae bacterium]